MNSRERFEAWWWPNGVPKYVRYDNGTYHGWNSNSVTAANSAWRGWQAALAAAAPPPDHEKELGESKKNQQNSGPTVAASPATVPSTTEEKT